MTGSGHPTEPRLRMLDELRCGKVYFNNVGPEQVQGYHSGTGLSGYGGDDGPHSLERYLRRQSVYLSYGPSDE